MYDLQAYIVKPQARMIERDALTRKAQRKLAA